jgi:hypothetical protein
MSSQIIEFRQSIWVAIVVGLGAVVSAVGFVVLAKTVGLGWQVWLLGGLSTIFLVGLADAVSSFVRLEPETLRMRNNFRHRTLKRDELVEVTWAKGCPVSVKNISGTWVQLPPLGDSPAIANSIRAWLKKAQQGAPTDAAKPRD